MSSPISRPEADEYAPFYAGYVASLEGAEVVPRLESQPGELRAMLQPLSEREALARYEPGKWSVKEVVGHMADTERVFAYRLLRISRGDPTPLPSFDENLLVQSAGFDRLPLADLLADFEAVRAATLSLLAQVQPHQWTQRGVASGHPVTARAIVHVMTGHVEHHLRILRERYGLAPRLEAAEP